MSIAEFSVNRRITVYMVALILLVFGIISYMNIGQDLLPDLEYPVMSVVTIYSGAKSEQVEKLVTKPLEEMLSTLDNVERVTSHSQQGRSVIQVEFKWGTDIDQAVGDARARINMIKAFLPDDAEDPVILKMDVTAMPVVGFAVVGMSDGYKMRKLIEDVLKPQLEQVPGVAMVFVQGGDVREIQVQVDKEALSSFGLTLGQVIQAVQMENRDETSGNVVIGAKENLVSVKGEFRSPQEIEDVTVAARPGRAIKVKDVARVVDGFKEVRLRQRCNGRTPTVFMAAMKQSGANTAATSVAVQKKLASVKAQLPAELEYFKVFDMGEMIARITKRMSENAAQGALLAILFVWLFLRNWRPTLVIFLAIPISVLAALIGMYFLDYTFNLMTLGGLALGVGMLVDNAVVVVENTFRHLELGKPRLQAAVVGGAEVGTAITASTLTTVAVFIPMVMVSGVASRLARPLAFTICLALAASLFVALTIVPAMTSTLFRASTPEEREKDRRKHRLFIWAQERYRQMLDYLIDKGWLVLALVLGMGAAAWLIAENMGGEFIPASDRPFLMYRLELPVGTKMEETQRVLSVLERRALEKEKEWGIKSVFASVGVEESDPYASAQGMNPTDVNGGMLMVAMEYYGEGRNIRVPAIENQLREAVPKIEVEGVRSEFSDPFGSMTSTSAEQAPVVIKVFGSDLERMREAAHRIRDVIAGIPGVSDAKVSFTEGKPEQTIRVDRELAAQYGLTTAQVASEVRTALDGRVIGRYREMGDEYDIRVRLEEEDRDVMDEILDLNIMTPSGVLLPLRQVAKVETSVGPQEITREDRRRRVAVTANVAGRDLVSAVDEMKERLAGLNKELTEQGEFVKYGGSYEDYQDTVRAMSWAFAAAVLLVYMVLAAQFESLVHPFVVMVTVPLGIVGVVLGLAITGKTLSLPSMIGFIILVGIIVNNAIVMVDYTNLLRREKGLPRRQAIIEAAVTRLRPILITSLTTIMGMMPMAFSRTQGSEMRGPMAISVASGLLFGMILTLVVIPTVYAYFDKWAESLRASLARILYKGEPPADGGENAARAE